MKGFINLYVNFDKFDVDQIDAIFQIIKRDNKEIFEMCAKSDFPLMLQPTQDEGSRMEKVNFNQPYPRFLKKNENEIFYSNENETSSSSEEEVKKSEEKSKFEPDKE